MESTTPIPAPTPVPAPITYVDFAKIDFRVATVQNELSVLNRKSATDGLVTLTREQGIVFLAHRIGVVAPEQIRRL